MMQCIEKELFLGTPLSKGADSSVIYLTGLVGFHKIKSDTVAKSYSIHYEGLMKEFAPEPFQKGQHLRVIFNIYQEQTTYENKFLIVAYQYDFVRYEHVEKAKKKIQQMLDMDKKVIKQNMVDAARWPYYRYYMPDGSAMNLKWSSKEDKINRIIIHWTPSP